MWRTFNAVFTQIFDVPRRSGLPSGTPMLCAATKRLAYCLTIVLLACGSLSTMAQQMPQHGPLHEHKRLAREQIEDMERQFQQAQLSGDVAAMDKLLSDDYLGIGASGELSTKAQQLDHMRNRMLVISKLQTSDEKIKIVGQIAIVTSLATVEGQLDGTPLHGIYRYTRVYQRLPNGSWKVTSFEATRRARAEGGPAAS